MNPLLPRCEYEIRNKHIILARRERKPLESRIPPMPRIIFKPIHGKSLSGIDDLLQAGVDPREWWWALEAGLIWTRLPPRLNLVCRADVSAVCHCDPPIGSECQIHRVPLLAWLEGVLTREQAYLWGHNMMRQLPGFEFFESAVRGMDKEKQATTEKVHAVAQQALLYPKPYAVKTKMSSWAFVD